MSTLIRAAPDGAGPPGPSGEVAADDARRRRSGARRRRGGRLWPGRRGQRPHRRGAPSGSGALSGKLQVVQVLDFHPDHNEFLKKSITDFAASKGWALDLSDLAGFLGGHGHLPEAAGPEGGRPAGGPHRPRPLRPADERLRPLPGRHPPGEPGGAAYGPAYSSARATPRSTTSGWGCPSSTARAATGSARTSWPRRASTSPGGLRAWQGVLEAAQRRLPPRGRTSTAGG